jgi:hypothetical protein
MSLCRYIEVEDWKKVGVCGGLTDGLVALSSAKSQCLWGSRSIRPQFCRGCAADFTADVPQGLSIISTIRLRKTVDANGTEEHGRLGQSKISGIWESLLSSPTPSLRFPASARRETFRVSLGLLYFSAMLTFIYAATLIVAS